jgi:hypothetical protein
MRQAGNNVLIGRPMPTPHTIECVLQTYESATTSVWLLVKEVTRGRGTVEMGITLLLPGL